MAALMRHGVLKTARITPAKNVALAGFATKAEKKKGIDKKKPPEIDSSAESIAAKGFLRPQRNYEPPEDVDAKVEEIFRKTAGNGRIEDFRQKFQLFSLCAKEFDHSVPNSLLHTIESLEDLKKFYRTRVNTTTPLDKLRDMELPENLHVQFEYHRFHPDTDTMFGGQTAFNGSSSVVTGLKYKDKYKGHRQSTKWPYNS